MANTYAINEGNGSTTTFAIPFSNYLQESHIIVRVAGVNYDSDTSGDYSFAVSAGNVVFDVAPASGVLFYILRDTLGKDSDSTALLYDFSDGSILTADQQDDVYRQNFYLSQEALERVPMYDSGWLNTFDGAAALAASTTLELTMPASVTSAFPWKGYAIYGKDSSDSWYPFATLQDIHNDVSWVVEADNWESIGLIAVYVSASDKLQIATGDYAWATRGIVSSGTEREWVTDITHLRVIIT